MGYQIVFGSGGQVSGVTFAMELGRWFEAVVDCGRRQQNHQQEHLQDAGNIFGFH